MKKVFLSIFQILFVTLLFFALLEIVFRFVGAPGASTFVEKVVLAEKLTPTKTKDEFRIFVYGESTMVGAQHAPQSSPPRWLEAYLTTYLPEKKVRVINFSRMGHGSAFTLDTFRETLHLKPDFTFFYLGHNDFLNGNRKDQLEPERQSLKFKLRKLSQKIFFISAVNRWIIARKVARKKQKLDDSMEYDVIETPPAGIGPENATPRNQPFYQENIQFFSQNVGSILKLAQQNHIPVAFFKPVSNLKDFTPFLSTHLRKLNRDDLRRWEAFYEAGLASEAKGNAEAAFGNYFDAYKIDPTYAELSFRLGTLELAKKNYPEAKRLFEEAKDNDTIIFRATKETLDALHGKLKAYHADWIDTERILGPEIKDGILGEPVIEDNVHFSIKGEALVGRAMANYLAERGFIAGRAAWQFEQEKSYVVMLGDLGINDDVIFGSYLKLVTYYGSRYENRIFYAQKAVELKPKDPKALRHLAWSYWLAGDQAKAKEIYARIKSLYPNEFSDLLKRQPQINGLFK